ESREAQVPAVFGCEHSHQGGREGYWSASITHTQIASFSSAIGANAQNLVVASAGDREPVCKQAKGGMP
ncbi:MAG: hypothetical protein ABI969_19705, partial [bacterium]